MKVLIVEDEKRLAQALGQIMEEQKYSVDTHCHSSWQYGTLYPIYKNTTNAAIYINQHTLLFFFMGYISLSFFFQKV